MCKCRLRRIVLAEEDKLIAPLVEIIVITAYGEVELALKSLKEGAFVPFFTTRKNVSGIGLSISREIMKMHN